MTKNLLIAGAWLVFAVLFIHKYWPNNKTVKEQITHYAFSGNVKAEAPKVLKDTVYIPTFDYAMKDSMIDEMNLLRDSLFNERYKVESVRYYLKICKHRPSQVKFLVSWIDRAIR